MSKVSKPFFIFYSIIVCLALVSRAQSKPITPESGIPLSGHAQSILKWEDEDGHGNIIGVEIGSTYSRVGILQQDKFTLLVNDQGQRETPSCVALTDEGPLIGSEALKYGMKHPENVICDVRQLLGRNFADPAFQDEIKSVPYKVVDNKGRPNIQVTIKGVVKTVTPEEITSHILRSFKRNAEQYLGRKVEYAVAAVPATANDSQRQSLKDAGILAGLTLLRIINESTGAGIAHNMDLEPHVEKVFFIYDLGATCLDVTLLVVENGVFETLATARNGIIGGEDFDNAFSNYIVEQATAKSNLRKTEHPRAFAHLKEQIRFAEEELKLATFSTIEVLAEGSFAGLSMTVTRNDLEALYQPLLIRTLASVDSVLKEAKVKKSEMTDIILTGSSEHIAKILPFFTALVKDKEFGNATIRDGFPFDQAVVRGAAIQGQVLSRYDGMDSCAYDCCLTMDVAALSLGIETQGGIFTSFIPRNTVIPTRKSRVVTTVRDNQEKIVLNIYEGERKVASKNNLLGIFVIDDIPPAPKGVPQIEVAFEHDPNYILQVSSSKNKPGWKERALTVQLKNRSYNWNETQIEEVIRDAEKYEQEDLEAVKIAAEMQGQDGDDFAAALVVPECPKCPERTYRGHRTPRPHTSIWDYISDWVEDAQEVIFYILEKRWQDRLEECDDQCFYS